MNSIASGSQLIAIDEFATQTRYGYTTCLDCRIRKPNYKMVGKMTVDKKRGDIMQYKRCKVCDAEREERMYYQLVSQPGTWDWGTRPMFRQEEMSAMLKGKCVEAGTRFVKAGRTYLVSEWGDRLRLAEV